MVLTLATVSFRRIHGVYQTVWEVAPDNSTVWFALIIFTWGDPRSYAIPPYVCLESPAEFRSCLYRAVGELLSYLCCRFRADASFLAFKLVTQHTWRSPSTSHPRRPYGACRTYFGLQRGRRAALLLGASRAPFPFSGAFRRF